MKLLKNFLPDWLVNSFNSNPKNTPWWIEVYTTNPQCLYYFGPFASFEEARQNRTGYIDDLFEEKAQGIQWQIKQTQPQALTYIASESQSLEG